MTRVWITDYLAGVGWGMAITRLNHAVLYVRDADRTADFLEESLGFVSKARGHGAVFLATNADTPNDHDLGLFSIGDDAAPSEAGQGRVGLYHLAWEVETLRELTEIRETMRARDALVGESDHGTSKSLYCVDPDGLEFEVMWAVPLEQTTDEDLALRTAPLDWEATLQRFGGDTAGRVTYRSSEPRSPETAT